VREDVEDVAKQALEFWCTVAEEEADAADAAAAGDPDPPPNHRFVEQALAPLTSLLLEQLTKQEEGQDADDGAWNLAMAAGTALGLAARAAGDAIVPLVAPFVATNLGADGGPDAWRAREAATFALGSVVDGPAPAALAPAASASLPRLLAALRDPSSQVRHTAAWTLGRLFEFLGSALPPGAAAAAVPALLAATADEAHVADKACYAISSIALAAAGDGGGPGLPAGAVRDAVAALFALADRAAASPDAASARAASSAYECINEVVRASPADAAPLVGQLVQAALQKLAAALASAPATPDARARASDLVALLCGVLTVALQRLAGDDAGRAIAAPHADAVMEAVLAVLASAAADAGGGGPVEEALLTAGALSYVAGPRFAAYLPAFTPRLVAALANVAEWQACQVAVGVLGDAARAVDAALAPHADAVMAALLATLQNPAARREVKPLILSAFGDVALALGGGFGPYVGHVIPVLASAAALAASAAAAAPPDDDDAIEYVDMLRHGVCEAYSGLFNGLSPPAGTAPDPTLAAALAAAAPAALDFCADVASRADGADSGVVRGVVSLTGDVAAAAPAARALVGARPTLAAFVAAAARSGEDASLARAGQWALAALNSAPA
jgi:importin subunit beta-1